MGAHGSQHPAKNSQETGAFASGANLLTKPYNTPKLTARPSPLERRSEGRRGRLLNTRCVQNMVMCPPLGFVALRRRSYCRVRS
jgi:hypothetical protein